MRIICVELSIDRTCLSWMHSHCPQRFSISIQSPTHSTYGGGNSGNYYIRCRKLMTYFMFRWSGADCQIIVASVQVRRDLISSTTVRFGKIGIDWNLSFAVAITLKFTAIEMKIFHFTHTFVLGFFLEFQCRNNFAYHFAWCHLDSMGKSSLRIGHFVSCYWIAATLADRLRCVKSISSDWIFWRSSHSHREWPEIEQVLDLLYSIENERIWILFNALIHLFANLENEHGLPIESRQFSQLTSAIY